MNTITGKVNAYMTKYSCIRPEDFKTPTAALITALQYTTPNNIPDGWTLVGEATVTLELIDQDAIVSNKVESLRAELQQHRADAHVAQKHLEDQISKLLAISYESTGAAQ